MKLRRDVFQAIADPTRRVILGLVAIQAMTPGAIAENFNFSRQTISKHIQILFDCNLLEQSQRGREIYYRINPNKLKEVAEWLEPYQKLWVDRMDAIHDLLTEIQSK